MKLSECVISADIRTLQKIAQFYQFTCSKNSKNELSQEIIYAFRTPEFIEKQIKNWQKEFHSIYIRLCLSGQFNFSVEEIHALFQINQEQMKKAKKHTLLDNALERGWIFLCSHEKNHFIYTIPEEIMRKMKEELYRTWKLQVLIDEEGPLLFHDENYAMSRDLEVFFQYIRHHEVQITTEGTIYKRYLQQILKLLEIHEEPPSGGWRFGYGRRSNDYPDRFALLYDFSYRHRFIEETQYGHLRLTDGVLSWFELDHHERQKKIVQFYISLYRRPIPRLPQIVRIIAELANSWVQSDSMFLVIEELINQFYYDSKMDVWNIRIIKMMMYLGLLRVGRDKNQMTWFQITKLGQQLLLNEYITIQKEEIETAKKIFIVQPNFDIMVINDHPNLTLQLAKFAQLRESGSIQLYRLSQKSVFQALQSGFEFSSLLDLLNECSQNPIPGNVERTLMEWKTEWNALNDPNANSLSS